MNGHDLHGPAEEDEEECLLPKKPGVKKLGEDRKEKKPTTAAKGGNTCNLPWFGSWSATLLAWVLMANSFILWSLPQPTFHGKLATFGELWYLDRLHQEKRLLEERLNNETQRIQALEGGASDADSLRRQLEAAKSESGRQRQEAEQARNKLLEVQARETNTSRSVDELHRSTGRLERQATDEKARADRLAAKLKRLRDAEM